VLLAMLEGARLLNIWLCIISTRSVSDRAWMCGTLL